MAAAEGGDGMHVAMAQPTRPPRIAGAIYPFLILLLGGVAGAGCIAGGVATGAALSVNATAQGEAAIYAICISVPLIVAALAGGALTGTLPIGREAAGTWQRAAGWSALGCGAVALASAGGGWFGGIALVGRGGTASAFLIGTSLVLLQATGEEIFLRGWLQPALARRWPEWTAILAAALLFAGLHVLGGQRAPVSLVNLVIGGVAFGVLAARSGGLAAPIALHMGWNWGEQFLLGLDPNPGIGVFGALYDLDLTGPAIWGGSDEGLNASLAMTIVLAGVLAAALCSRRAIRPGETRFAAIG